MLDKLIEWADSVDWNKISEWVLANYEIIYYFPLPIILIGAYYLFKSLGSKYNLLNFLLALLTTAGFGLYHKKHITVSESVDFELIGAVATEFIAGSSIALLAIFIFMCRGIYSLFTKKKINVQKA